LKIPYLVGGIPTPLKNMSSSVGVTIPNILYGKIKNVPNHQPGQNANRFETANQISSMLFCLESVSGWWFFASPLKNDRVRQLG